MARVLPTPWAEGSLRVLLAGMLVLSGVVAAAGTPSTLLVLGDSISAAYGVAPGKGWVALLRERLADHDPARAVINASISGETTERGQTRLPAALERDGPTVVVIQLGLNDGMQGLPLEAMRANLAGMVEQAQASGARVLLLGVRLPARYGSDYGRRFEDVYQEVADATGATLVPRALAAAGDDNVADRRERLLGGGSVHPDARGHALILENAWPGLLPLLHVTARSVHETSGIGVRIRTRHEGEP